MSNNELKMPLNWHSKASGNDKQQLHLNVRLPNYGLIKSKTNSKINFNSQLNSKSSRRKARNHLLDIRKSSLKDIVLETAKIKEWSTHENLNRIDNSKLISYIEDLSSKMNECLNYAHKIDETNNYYQMNPNIEKLLGSNFKKRGSTSQEKRSSENVSRTLLEQSVEDMNRVNNSVQHVIKAKNLPQILIAGTPVKTSNQMFYKNKASRSNPKYGPAVGFSVNQTPKEIFPTLEGAKNRSVSRISKIAEKVGFKLPRSLSQPRHKSVNRIKSKSLLQIQFYLHKPNVSIIANINLRRGKILKAISKRLGYFLGSNKPESKSVQRRALPMESVNINHSLNRQASNCANG